VSTRKGGNGMEVRKEFKLEWWGLGNLESTVFEDLKSGHRQYGSSNIRQIYITKTYDYS
jgi:hypothetical protein